MVAEAAQLVVTMSPVKDANGLEDDPVIAIAPNPVEQ